MKTLFRLQPLLSAPLLSAPLLLGTFLLPSCTSAPLSSGATYTLHIDTLKPTAIPLKKLKYIPLEQTRESVLGDYQQVVHRDSLFYLFDFNAKRVFVYDEQGNHVRQINAVGNAANEYILINNFDVDREHGIWIYDGRTSKLLRYPQAQGEKVEVVRIKEGLNNMALFDSSTLYCMRVYETDGNVARLGKIELPIGRYTTLLPDDDELRTPMMIRQFSSPTQEDLYIYGYCGYDVHKLAHDTLTHYIEIVSEHKLDEYDLAQYLENAPQHWGRLALENKVFGLNSFFETAHHILLRIADPFPTYYLIDKASHQVCKIMNTVDYDRIEVVGATADYFIGKYNTSKHTIEYLQSLDEEVEGFDRLPQLTLESNPTLLLFTFDTP